MDKNTMDFMRNQQMTNTKLSKDVSHLHDNYFKLLLAVVVLSIAVMGTLIIAVSAHKDHPVTDEEHFYDLESTEAEEYWKNTSMSERIELADRWSLTHMVAQHDYLPETRTGELCTW